MSMDHHHPEGPAGHSAYGEPRPVDSTLRLAFERLLDQIDPHGAPAAAAHRDARRLCGRWLMLRRGARGLARAQVAARTAIPEPALELLELGLLDRADLPEEQWLRLGLILEATSNDYEHVVLVLRIASGGEQALDFAFLERLAQQLPGLEGGEPAPAAAPVVLLPLELHDDVRGILEALEATGGVPLTAYGVKKWLEQNRQLSLSLAVLPRKLAALTKDLLITSAPGERSLQYVITPEGVRVLALDQQRREAIARTDEYDQNWKALVLSKPSLSGA